jgi:short-subunit dehydrogenase
MVLITGASSGIGEATARLFATQGADIMLTARREDRLKVLAAELGCRYFAADIRNVNQVKLLVEKTAGISGRIDILVNNAGLGYFGNFHEQSWENIRETLDTNIAGSFSLVHSVLPLMVARKSGVIVNVSSVLSKRTFPGLAAYSASKYALDGLSDSLRKELKNTGVHVCHFCPRSTATGFHEKAGLKPSWLTADSPAHVARALLNAVLKRKSEVILSWPEKILIKFKSIFG